MNGRYHFFTATIFFVTLALLIEEITFTMIFAPIGLIFYPDVDLYFKTHRNFFSHSIIPWAIIFLFDQNIMYVLFMVSSGFHLLCDVTLRPSKWTGYYVLKRYKKGIFPKGKQGVFSTLWYIGNFVLSITILLLFLEIDPFSYLSWFSRFAS